MSINLQKIRTALNNAAQKEVDRIYKSYGHPEACDYDGEENPFKRMCKHEACHEEVRRVTSKAAEWHGALHEMSLYIYEAGYDPENFIL